MCPVHHDVIDADPESYTVTRLLEIKAAHESAHSSGPEPTDDVARQFIANIVSNNTVTNGSIIISQNQLGGQVAHSITNLGPQPRRISHATGLQLIEKLKLHPPERTEISSAMGDAEALELVDTLDAILQRAGWQTIPALYVFSQAVRDVRIVIPAVTTAWDILFTWLAEVGFRPYGEVDPSSSGCRIIIGARA
jgi:hypothetical protein